MKGEMNVGIFDRLFNRSSKKAEQQDELRYRIALSEVRRQASALRKEAERCRNEAYRLEIGGNHAAAVSKAAEAANTEKAYEAAQSTLQRCESMHAQARNQKMLTDLMAVCEDMSSKVMKQIDTVGAMRIQSRLQQTTAAMEEAQEDMAAFQEGFDPNAEPTLRVAAGEDALAAIMAERAVQTPPPALSTEPVQAPAETAEAAPVPEDGEALARAEWLKEKRRQLAEIA